MRYLKNKVDDAYNSIKENTHNLSRLVKTAAITGLAGALIAGNAYAKPNIDRPLKDRNIKMDPKKVEIAEFVKEHPTFIDYYLTEDDYKKYRQVIEKLEKQYYPEKETKEMWDWVKENAAKVEYSLSTDIGDNKFLVTLEDGVYGYLNGVKKVGKLPDGRVNQGDSLTTYEQIRDENLRDFDLDSFSSSSKESRYFDYIINNEINLRNHQMTRSKRNEIQKNLETKVEIISNAIKNNGIKKPKSATIMVENLGYN